MTATEAAGDADTAAPAPAGPDRRADLRQLIRYGLVGGSGVALDLLAFLLLFNVLGLDEQVANIISTSLGITNNFVLNAIFTFDKRDRLFVRFLRFYAVGVTGIALTYVLFQIFTSWLGVDANIVKAGSLPLVLATQFVLNRKWSFG